MKYFRHKTVVKDFTTLGLVISPDVVSYLYSDTLAGVEVTDSKEFLANQHKECEVTELTFEEAKPELESCRMFHDINKIVQKLIADKYEIADEIKLLKLDKADPVYVEYQNYVDSCRAIAINMKIERGLKLP